MDIMIDIETVGTGPDACILTIAAQTFDPLSVGYQKQDYYARVDVDSQPDREVDDATVEWWATQPKEAQDEAFGEEGRISLKQALEELSKLCFHCKLIIGEAREKFATIAGPQGGTALNGAQMKAEGNAIMDAKIEELKLYVDGSQPLMWVIG